jgi:hypothetical protein
MVNGKLQRKYLILLVPRAESNHRHCDFQSRRNRKEFNNLAPDRLENVPIVINKLIANGKLAPLVATFMSPGLSIRSSLSCAPHERLRSGEVADPMQNRGSSPLGSAIKQDQ